MNNHNYSIPGVLNAIVTDVPTRTMFGQKRVRYINYVHVDEHMPTIIVASLMLVEMAAGDWVLGHILVEDTARGTGLSAIIVATVEYAHGGPFRAIWCTPAAEKFARKYVEKFGPRPSWRIGGYTDAELAAGMKKLEGARS